MFFVDPNGAARDITMPSTPGDELRGYTLGVDHGAGAVLLVRDFDGRLLTEIPPGTTRSFKWRRGRWRESRSVQARSAARRRLRRAKHGWR